MKQKAQQISPAETYRRCQCGWVGTFSQLSVWLRQNKVVSKICPHCGSLSSKHKTFLPQVKQSLLVH